MYRLIYDWLGTSNYYVADSFHFERIDVDIAQEDYCELELYLPVIDMQQNNSQIEKYSELYKSFFDIDEIMKII
ncbi:MAG: hypothetical protein GX227_08435 [Clostridiaceae bacterium]|jgi:hypothetical protein|nr:hypothetical protein [Clostridiaceae bacterium]